MIRIDKYLSAMEVGTRSEVKKLIQKGKVLIDGQVVKDPGQKVEPRVSQVIALGQVIEYQQYEYYLFHKPAGCVSAHKDSLHTTVMDYMKGAPGKNLSFVGRLDLDTEGLLIITNDGEFSHSLLSPKKHVEKVYYALVDGHMDQEDVQAFQKGIDIGEDKLCQSAQLEILEAQETSKVMITIREGKFHQVKRMVKACGKEVIYLKRLKMGRYELEDGLKPGEYRRFTKEELSYVEQYKRGTI